MNQRPPMRIVAEPSPPLDADEELALDASLADLGLQLQSESRMLLDLADGAPAASTADIDSIEEQFGDLASRLQSESRQLANHLAQMPPAAKPRSTWTAAFWRIVPVASAAALLLAMTFWNEPREDAAPSASDVEVAADQAPTDGEPSLATEASIPWQDLSSPELEGALDLVDEVVSISI